MFATANYDKHRIRRNAISHFFSRQSIRCAERIIKEKAEDLCRSLELEAQTATNGVVELRKSLLAFGTDVVVAYALGLPRHTDLLSSVEAQIQWRNTVYSLEDLTPIGKQIPWMIHWSKHLPLRLLDHVWPDTARILRLHAVSHLETDFN